VITAAEAKRAALSTKPGEIPDRTDSWRKRTAGIRQAPALASSLGREENVTREFSINGNPG
jgi:hypothetical protein